MPPKTYHTAVVAMPPPEIWEPNLSVGQAASPSQRQQLLGTLQAAWQPVQFTLTAMTLIWREADGPFQIAQAIPLGGSGRDTARPSPPACPRPPPCAT